MRWSRRRRERDDGAGRKETKGVVGACWSGLGLVLDFVCQSVNASGDVKDFSGWPRRCVSL